MDTILRILGVIVLMVTPCYTSAQGEDWAVVIKEGRVVNAQTFNTSQSHGEFVKNYSKETIFNVLFQGKMWMCWHVFETVPKRHEFWCEESNKK